MLAAVTDPSHRNAAMNIGSRKPGLDQAAITAHNLELARRINDSGHAYITPSILKGTQMLRVSIGAETTERRHVEALWATLCLAAD